jgi:sec-independent protein translocase protein TatA
MAGLGWQELVIVLVIIMIIFGAGKLPEIAKSLGQGVKEFREEANSPIAPQSTANATETSARAAADRVVVEPSPRIDDATEPVGAESSSRDAI